MSGCTVHWLHMGTADTFRRSLCMSARAFRKKIAAAVRGGPPQRATVTNSSADFCPRELDWRTEVCDYVSRFRKSRIAWADFSEMPGRVAISSGVAALMRATLPNFSSSRRFLLADMPGQSSSRLSLHAAAVEQCVVAVGEAVGLVADALEQLERAAVVRDADRLAAAGHEDLLVLLGQADDGQLVQAERCGVP